VEGLEVLSNEGLGEGEEASEVGEGLGWGGLDEWFWWFGGCGGGGQWVGGGGGAVMGLWWWW